MNEDVKLAFWGAIGRGLWSGAKGLAGAAGSAVKGSMGFGHMTSLGNKAVNKAVGYAAPMVMTGMNMANTLGGGVGGGPGLTNPFTGTQYKMGSERATTGSVTLDNLTKIAFAEHMSPSDLVDAAAYAAFAGSKFVDPHEHPLLHTALDAGALAALAGTTGYGMLSGKEQYQPGVKDLIGLGLMGSALYDRVKSH